MDVYLTSLGAALASVEKWYTAGIRQSLAKWSLKQLFTLAVHDLGEASEEITRTVARRVDVPGCSELLQQCKDHLQVSAVVHCPWHHQQQQYVRTYASFRMSMYIWHKGCYGVF